MNTDPIKATPHATGPEKAVISVLLQYPEMMDEVPSLTADHFHLPATRILFGELKAMAAAGMTVEVVSLSHRLHETGNLDRIGGPSTLAELMTYQPSPLQLKQHCGILTEYAARRAAITRANQLIEAAYGEEIAEVAAASGRVASSVEAVLTHSTEPPTMDQLAIASACRFMDKVKGATDAKGVPTIDLIDQHLRGLHGGRFWVIGAYPEGGKSVLASQMCLDAAMAGHPTAFITLEMSERDLMDRLIIQAARVDAQAFTDPLTHARWNGRDTVTKADLAKIQQAIQLMRTLPMLIRKPANRRLPTVLASIRRAHRETGAKAIAVDYLQLVKQDAESKEAELSEVSHALQEEAHKLDCTIIGLSQLNADGDTKHGRVIEEDADAWINIVQDRNKDSETFKKHRFIQIIKDRHYGTGGTRIPLILDRATIRFVEGQDETEAAMSKKKPNFSR